MIRYSTSSSSLRAARSASSASTVTIIPTLSLLSSVEEPHVRVPYSHWLRGVPDQQRMHEVARSPDAIVPSVSRPEQPYLASTSPRRLRLWHPKAANASTMFLVSDFTKSAVALAPASPKRYDLPGGVKLFMVSEWSLKFFACRRQFCMGMCNRSSL